MAYFLAAISLGFLGSFHCIGMCGPIALALPVHQLTPSRKTFSILSYQLGRISTYALLGVLFGLIGQSFALFGFQQALSVIVGSLVLLVLLVPQRLVNSFSPTRQVYAWLARLKQHMARLFQKRSIASFFGIGLLNGLLPCGLVYVAIAGAIAAGSVWKGMLFMAFFGIGTSPLMFSLSYTSHILSVRVRHLIHKAVPILTGVMAVLLILRGLNLGISYISPKLETNLQDTTARHATLKCCHKP